MCGLVIAMLQIPGLGYVCENCHVTLLLRARVSVCLFDLILYVPSTIFQLNRDGSSWAEPVLS